MNNKKSILYEKYLESQKSEAEVEEIAKDTGIDSEKIVVKKVSTIAHFFEVVTDVAIRGIKVMLYIVFFALASIGATVLINGVLREALLDLIQTSFF